MLLGIFGSVYHTCSRLESIEYLLSFLSIVTDFNNNKIFDT